MEAEEKERRKRSTKLTRDRIAFMPVGVEKIAGNLEQVRARIARAADRARRRPEEVTLVGVTKSQPAEAIRAAYEAGVCDFGENRVQEWELKQPLLADLSACWHLIGHLQSNKARRAARVFHMIDSVDSLPLAQKLNDAAAESGLRLPVLIEVKTDPEPAKSGVPEEEAFELGAAILRLESLELRGLMTVPPFLQNAEEVRPFFRRLARLRESLRQQLGRALPDLSMGMSHDFEVAIEEGATQIRVGTALFGARTSA